MIDVGTPQDEQCPGAEMGVHGGAHREVNGRDLAAEALLRAVVETSDDAIFTCDAGATVTTWSATAERLFGRPAAEVLEGRLEDLFPVHLRRELQVVIATVLAGDRIRHFETEVLRPDGMPVPVSMSLCPLFDAGDLPVGSVVIARDVTEQHLAQASLAEVEARLEEGEALAHVGSWLWDLRTGVVQWSAEFHRIHAVDPLEFDGTFESHLMVIHADDRERVRAAMEQSVTSGRPFEAAYRVECRDGSARLVRVRAQPTMGSAGTAVGLRGIGQDVTGLAEPHITRDQRGA
jgi:PAS domain S-box-containing protein